MAKWKIKKYEGDDLYSWALFRDGVPVITGMGRMEARHERRVAIAREKAGD